jgi:serine acetyltransferase
VTRLRLAFLAERLGIDIPLGVFGPGLAIVHSGGIVVGDMAKVGAPCRCTIGAGAKIGPLALVNQDAPVGSVVVAARGTMPERRAPRAA